MKRYLPFIIVGTVALLAVGSATALYRAKRPVPLSIPKTEASAGGDSVHTLGPASATVTLEEFGDFQCPPCGALSDPLNQLVRDFPKLRIIFRHFPLAVHQHAMEAAMAAEAAGMQGHFWQMHDIIYRDQAIWSQSADARGLFSNYAGMLGLKRDQFQKDMMSNEAMERVKSDQREGTKLQVTNTPTIFLNNHAVPPTSLNARDLRSAVQAAMKETPSPH
jgi:protein-disulfide isomerase